MAMVCGMNHLARDAVAQVVEEEALRGRGDTRIDIGGVVTVEGVIGSPQGRVDCTTAGPLGIECVGMRLFGTVVHAARAQLTTCHEDATMISTETVVNGIECSAPMT